MSNLKCENCNWVGPQEKLATIYVADKLNPKGQFLTEVKVCPNCQQEDTLKPEHTNAS